LFLGGRLPGGTLKFLKKGSMLKLIVLLSIKNIEETIFKTGGGKDGK